MKKTLLFLLFLYISTALYAQTNESRSRDLIKKYLYKTLDDFSSYEPIEFSKLQPLNSEVESMPEFKEYTKKGLILLDSVKFFDKLADEYIKEYGVTDPAAKLATIRALELLERVGTIRSQQDSLRKNFVTSQVGWSCIHTFRAKNRNGNNQRWELEFHFDKATTKIEEIYDLDE